MTLVLVDGGKYKDMIAGRLHKKVGAKGSWMVNRDCDEEYAQQVTAEQKVSKKNTSGKEVLVWVPKSSHAANHYLDAEVYTLCAADILGVRQLYLQQEQQKEVKKVPERKVAEDDWLSGGRW